MFLSPVHAALFHKQGFVKFPLLNDAVMMLLKGIYQEFNDAHQLSPEKFRGTGWIQNETIVNAINERVHPVMTPVLAQHFQTYEILGYNYLQKERGTDSAVPPHQDWTYVDESLYYSMNIWIALQDITIHDGCLYMIPGSHRYGAYLRPAPSYPIPFAAVTPFLSRFKRPIEMKAGDCVCFNNKTIHGSYPNMGDTMRLALVTTLYPTDAKLLHHYVPDVRDPGAVVEYEIDKKTFLNITRGKAPSQFISKRNLSTSYPVLGRTAFLNQWVRSIL